MSGETTAYLFGYSHAWALKAAAANRRSETPSLGLRVVPRLIGSKTTPGGIVVTQEGERRLNPAFEGHLEGELAITASDDTWIVSLYGTGYYSWLGLLERPDPFDFVLPEREDLRPRPGVQLIPYDAVLENFRKGQFIVEEFFELLRAHGFNNVAHCEAPPPSPDNEFAANAMVESGAYPSREAFTLAPPEFRLKLWHCQQTVMKEICERKRVLFVPSPAECIDSTGYLLKEFWRDGLHATREHGARTLAKLEAAILGRTQEGAQ